MRFRHVLIFLLLLFAAPSHAQTATKIVSACGGEAFAANSVGYPLEMTTTGNLCTNASGGGGGGSVTQGTVPWVDDITQWANVALGAPSNYGTSPGAVAVPGVNAFVTNSVAVTGTFFQATQPVSAASLPLPTGAATSANQEVTAAGTSAASAQGVQGVTGGVAMPVSLAANQSVNVAQFGGTSTSTGQVAVSVAPVTATNTALVVDLRPDSPGIITLGPAAIANSIPTIPSSQYPANATAAAAPVTATATGTTAATVATLAAVSGKTTFICGFTITADATALAVGTATVAGTVSGSLNYLQGISAVTSGAGNLTQSFTPCIPASAANTAITVTSAAAGSGGNTIVNAQGYYL